MRVLVVDQDSASNLAITRSLRDLYSVDCVTNKGDCLDLLRSNTFEVIVATERLEDGSGLELLGQIAKKWPSVLRIFAADRQRLQLLRGRLGPFELFQTLTYPIDPERLIATLSLADAAQNADADTSDIQHVELSGELAAEEPEVAQQPVELSDSAESEESENFPAPQPAPRVAPIEHAQAAWRGGRAASRGAPAHRPRPTPVGRPRRNGAAGSPPIRGASGPSGAPSTRGASGPSGAPSTRSASGPSGAPSTRDAFGPSGAPSARGPSSAAPGPGRSRGAGSKAPPVKFPPLERVPPLEQTPPAEPLENSHGRRSGASNAESFAEAAAMARSARSNYESSPAEFDIKRRAVMVGGGLAAVVVVVFLSFKIFGSKSEAPHPAAPPVAHAPEFPREVTDLIAQTEDAFKADDFKAARADVDKLHQISPSHPRLAFFEGLLTARADGAKSGTSGARGVPKKNGQPSRRNESSTAGATSASAPSRTGSPADASSPDSPALAPETPVGFSRATVASAESQHTDATGSPAAPGAAPMSGAAPMRGDAPTPGGAPMRGSAPMPGAAPVLGAAPTPGAESAPIAASAPGAMSVPGAASGAAPTTAMAAATTASPAHAAAAPATAPAANPATASASASSRPGDGEPPPVIQEAKLIRPVNPEYPSAAKKEGVAGSVDLEVTVSAQGVVEDVSVVQGDPPGLFEKSALAAVRKWRYDPRFVDGLPSQAHLKVHLDFGPNK